MLGPSGSLTRLALQKFKKNYWSVFSLFIYCGVASLAVFAYVIAPDNSVNANQMHLSIHSKSPGFKVIMLTSTGIDDGISPIVFKRFF